MCSVPECSDKYAISFLSSADDHKECIWMKILDMNTLPRKTCITI